MTLGKKSLFGLLIATALGVSAAYASEPGDKAAATKLDVDEATEAWLYLGRRSGDKWRPAAVSLSRPRYPVKPGGKVVVKRDALVYGSVDCTVIEAADFKPDEAARSALLVKADRKGLEIVGPPLECPSIGRAKTVWANVRIPAARLVSVER
jgi:hypothetical protein